MLADLLPYRDCLDWTDEFILKAVKDPEWVNIVMQEFNSAITAHERLYKLKALAEKEDNE